MKVEPIERALSLKPAWAWAVLHGKPVENRTWWTAWRGPLFIHASAQVKRAEHAAAVEQIRVASARRRKPIAVPHLDWLMENVAGRLLARTRLTDCVLPGFLKQDPAGDPSSMRERFLANGKRLGLELSESELTRFRFRTIDELAFGDWYFAGHYGYVLEDTTELREFVPCAGRQGLWKVPPEALAAANAAAR